MVTPHEAEPPAQFAPMPRAVMNEARGTYGLDVVRSASELAGLRAEWNALVDAGGATAFLSWDWLYPWYRRLGADRELFVLRARNALGQLAGLMPLALERRWVGPRRVRRLAFLGETHVGSDYLDVIAGSGEQDAVARAFAGQLESLRAEWDVLDLVDLREDSPTLAALRERFEPAGSTVLLAPRYTCPHEVFAEGESFDTFLRRTGRRDNYLRRKKWLEKQPGYRVERVDAPASLAPALSDFFHLHALRWSADGGSQGIKGPTVEAFHRDATHLLAERGRLRLYTMRVGGAAVASVYGLFHGGAFLYFQSGYDPAWRNRSVGLVLVGETFKDALERGCREYDFLRGTEGYKADWTRLQRQTVSLRVHARRGAGAWFTSAEKGARAGREAAKRLLSTGVVERIRRLRRQMSAV